MIPGVKLSILMPVYNEAATLRQNITKLHDYVHHNLPYRVTLAIAVSGSTDDTQSIADSLAAELPGIRVVSETEKGRVFEGHLRQDAQRHRRPRGGPRRAGRRLRWFQMRA